jgi:hypothetical protein
MADGDEREDGTGADEIGDDEIAMLLGSLGRTALGRRAIIASASGPRVEEQRLDGRAMPDAVAERLDRFRQTLTPLTHLDLRGAIMHKVTDELDLTMSGWFEHVPPPEPRDLLHVYGPDRGSTGEQRYYRWAWLDHSPYGSAFSTTAPAVVRSGRLAGTCGVYSGQWAFSVGGAGMLFTAKHGASRVQVRPYVPWVALTSFNHHCLGASVVCHLGILVESWRPGDAQTQPERDHFVTVVSRTSAEGYLFDSETSGTSASSTGLVSDFVAVPGRRYGIYVYAWLESNGGAPRSGPLGYARIEVDASVPFVVAQETLL